MDIDWDSSDSNWEYFKSDAGGRGKGGIVDYWVTSIRLTEGNHSNTQKLRALGVYNKDISIEGVLRKYKHA